MPDSELVNLSGGTPDTPIGTDLTYGVNAAGTVDKLFDMDGMAASAPFADPIADAITALDEMADGVRSTINTGTPGFQAVDVVLSGGKSGGDTLTGGTASGDDLTLASTAHATRGTIFVRDEVSLLSEDKTNTTTTPILVLNVANAITLADAGGGLNPGNNLVVVRFASTVLYDNDGGILGSASLFVNDATLKNRNGETRTIYGVYTYIARPTFQADGATVTASGHIGYTDSPTFSVLLSGVMNAAGVTALASTATVNTGATVTLRRGVVFSDSTGAGTVTTAVGVDIEALADATTSIGIRNASTSVKTPKANANITAVSATIAHTAAVVSLTADASYTLTSAPTITDGVNGEELLIINVDTADTITIQDQGTLASSNLRLVTATIALGPRDSVRLVYSSTVGDWVQVSPVTNVI